MRWQPLAPFAVRHAYPAGQDPRDDHPPGWGKLELHSYGAIQGGWHVAVHSTRRRADGWSFNVAELQSQPMWLSYFHHLPTGKRLRVANSPNALQLAQEFDAL